MASAPTLILLAGLILAFAPGHPRAADAERTVKDVRFAKGASSAVMRGRIVGYQYVDYRLKVGAGQRLEASLKAGNRANYFNVLPPGSEDAAMFIGSTGGARFAGLLPDDGVYVLRVYLMRNEARRKHASDYTLTVSVAGKPLPALSPKADALVPGTRYHATSTVPCEPGYTQARQCEAGVVRRGTDGTATVELRWVPSGNRRILFVKGKPEAADVPQAFTLSRNERGDYVIVFRGDERFEIPEALVFGG